MNIEHKIYEMEIYDGLPKTIRDCLKYSSDNLNCQFIHFDMIYKNKSEKLIEKELLLKMKCKWDYNKEILGIN